MVVSEEFKGFKYAYEINLDWDNTATKLIKLVGHNKDVLEFGCGPGHMSKVLTEKMGCKVTGIEIDQDAAKVAEKYCEKVYVIDLDKEDINKVISDKQFDVLLFGDILEHLRDPARLLGGISKLLRPTAYVVASVPNISYCGVIAELLDGKFTYRESGLLDRTHVRFFTGKSFAAMFKEQGFAIETIEVYKLLPEHSEFHRVFKRLSSPIRKILLEGQEALVYQYIIKAKQVQQRVMQKVNDNCITKKRGTKI